MRGQTDIPCQHGGVEVPTIDLINFIVGVVCAFILGMATHSTYLHEKARRGWKFPWNHDEEKENKWVKKSH